MDARELEGRPTGVGRYLHRLLRSCVEISDRERFTLYHQHEPTGNLPLLAGHEIRRIPSGWPRGGLWWQQVRLARALRREPPDLLFAPADSLPLAYGGRVLLTVHDLSYFAHPEWFGRGEGMRRRTMLRLAVRRAERIIAVSRFTRDELIRSLAVPPERIEVVHHSIDDHLHRYEPVPEARLREIIGFPHPFVLMVGSLFERRMPLSVIGAFRHLRDLDLGLVIVGEDRRRHRADLEREIADRGVADRVKWTRFCSEEELAGLYRSAQQLIYLSEYEGFGLPPLEGMSFGLPVIVSGRGALREVYGRHAWTVEEESEQSIAEAIRRLATDPALREGLRRKGAELVSSHEPTRCALRTLEVMRGLDG